MNVINDFFLNLSLEVFFCDILPNLLTVNFGKNIGIQDILIVVIAV